MKTWKLWLRWSWRDLRARWLQVIAIALIVALGSGIYAGLGSSEPWRVAANDRSYAQLAMYDLRLTMTTGSLINAETLLQALKTIPHADSIRAAEVRLISATAVDASTADHTILVPGQIVGVQVAQGGPHVNGIYINDGRGLTASDAGQPVAVLEQHFATYYHLPASGAVQISGSKSINYVGTGMNPEYFMVSTDDGGLMAESNFAALFVSLETAQQIAGTPGMANDLLVRVAPGADLPVMRTEIEQAVKGISTVGFKFMTPQDDKAYNMLYEDAKGDSEMFNILACLFLVGAALGCFNLANRMVEAQRREIGISMALGVPARLIVIRPLLVALQIALGGVVLGIGIGFIFNGLFGAVMLAMMPLPVFETPFQPGVFVQAALIGIAIPLLATLYPVWRAVRVAPVDAIRTGHLVAKNGGFAPMLGRRLPGNSLFQMPLRNLLRTPRRTLMTLLGIAVAIITLITIMGMLDSCLVALDQQRAELLTPSPDRLDVNMNFFYPTNSPFIDAIRQSPMVSEVDPILRLGGYLIVGDQQIETLLDFVNFDSKVWKPSVIQGTSPVGKPGILIAEKAARDLGIAPGQKITLRHPQRDGLFSYRMVDSQIEVVGFHGGLLRFMSYMSLDQASLMGVQGLTNVVQVRPAAGSTPDDVQRSMFRLAGVASVQPVSATIKVFENLIGLFLNMLSIVVAFVVLLAFLITYNSTSINVDERAREIATMFAFGLPIHRVTAMLMIENLITGILGTLVGIALGFVGLQWLLVNSVGDTMPELSITASLGSQTLLTAMLCGVLVVMFTPLLNIRKMMRMNIPATLRVME